LALEKKYVAKYVIFLLAPYTVIQNPTFNSFAIQNPNIGGILILGQFPGIQNPQPIWNPEFKYWNPESKEWNPESNECMDYLTWADSTVPSQWLIDTCDKFNVIY
jgi:hypothetical protein